MKILLDTHVFLWTLDDSPHLPAHIRETFQSGEHEMFLSVASLWEIAVKVSTGKLVIPVKDIQSLAKLAEERDTRLLEVRPEHLDRLKELPLHHRDPFDRLIVCQAQAERMVLASIDGIVRKYDVELLG